MYNGLGSYSIVGLLGLYPVHPHSLLYLVLIAWQFLFLPTGSFRALDLPGAFRIGQFHPELQCNSGSQALNRCKCVDSLFWLLLLGHPS